MADIIGALRVVIGADTAALDKGLKGAESSLGSFAKQVGTIAAGIKLEKILTSAFDSISHAIKKSVVQADDFGKMAQKVGMPVEEFSKLAYAAGLSDVSVEQLGNSLNFLNKNMVAVAGGAKGPAAEAFKAMRINVENTNGSLKTQRQVFDEIATKFAGYEDGAAKAALANAIFGKTGKEIIPLLNEGAAGIKRMADEAVRFGIVITQDMANSAQNFNDNIKRIGSIIDGLLIQISGPLATALDDLSTKFVAAAGDGNLMKEAGKAIVEVMAFLSREIAVVVVNIKALGDHWAALQNLLKADVFTSGAVTDAWQKWNAVSDQTAAKVRNVDAEYQKFISNFRENVNSPWAGTVTELKNMSAELGRAFQGWLKMPAPIIQTGNATSKLSDEARKAAAEMKRIADAGFHTFMDTRTPLEAFTIRVRELDQQLAQGAIDAETYARAVSKAKNEMVKANPAAQILEQSLGSAFDRFLDGTMSAIEQLKAFGRDLAKLAAQAAFKALLFGPQSGTGGSGLLGGLFAGGGLLGGGGLFGFAKGGSFTVGGSGAIDSQLVAFKATPGERVDVRTPGQQRDMGGAQAGPVQVDARTKIVNAFDSVGFLSEALGSSAGERVLLNFVRANPGAFRAAISG